MPAADTLQMALHTNLGDSLLFGSMSAREQISQLFEFEVIALATDPNVGTDDLLGTPAAVSIDVDESTKRWFHGIVAAYGFEGFDGRHFRFRLSLRPWLWLLTRSANLRVFQEMTVLDIVQEVFADYTFELDDQTSGSHAARPYCLQYRESDFNFVSRLLEEEGICYFFTHEENKHTMVLADAPGPHATVTGFENVLFLENTSSLSEYSALVEWSMRHEIQTGKITLGDYNFETPSTQLRSTQADSTRSHPEATHEVYDYPGLFGVAGDGDALATLRKDEHSGRFTRFVGRGNVPAITCGTRFTLTNHPRDDQNIEYLVLQTQIDMQTAGYEAGVEDTRFACSLVTQKYAEPFHPPRITRKPDVAGPQTALVVGTGDPGAIHTDEHGRVKVQFHWDRLGEKNAESSCWVRVATSWAGNGWGMISLPRLGQEVVVAFLEGDPDQPIIVGSVYNAEQKPPYELPDNATVSTIKSRSKEGAAADFNELRFEDKPGSEYVLLHAQKDRIEFIEETLKAETGMDEHRTIKGNRKEKVAGTEDQHVVGVVKQLYDDKLNQKVGGDMLFDGGGIWSLKTASDFTVESGAAVSFKSSTDLHLKIGSNIGAEAGQNVHIKGGMNIVIEGGIQISIKAGGSSVVLGPDGVSITGAMVKINSGGSPGSGNGASPVAPTAPADAEDPEAPQDPLTHR